MGVLRRLRLVLATGVVAPLALAAGVAAAPGETPSQAEAGFVERIASEREGRGLGGLSVAGDLVDVARRHSAEMAAAGRVYHNPELGSDVQGWEVVGENVGAGADVEQLHAAFMASKVHRDEILFPSYLDVGVGVAHGADGRMYVTQLFREPRVRAASSPAAPAAAAPAPAPPAATTTPPSPPPRAGASAVTKVPPTTVPPPPPATAAVVAAPPAPVPTSVPAGPSAVAAAPQPALDVEDVAEAIPAPAAVAAALLLAVVAAQCLAVRRLGLA